MQTPWKAAEAAQEAAAPSHRWSAQQVAIFAWFAAAVGNLVVRARAGTGKTTTILEGLRHIPGACRVLVCAFNKRIQLELSSKLRDPRAEAKTLHALGLACITRAWGRVKLDDTVEDDRIAAVAGGVHSGALLAIKKLIGVAKGSRPFGTVADLVDLALDFGVEAEAEAQQAGWNVDRVAEVARKAMDAAKVRDPEARITFDDMLFVPVACGLVRPVYEWVIVDEAQDMNASQLLLAQQSCKPGGHVVVVGDDKQAIYGFRGADSGSIDRLKAELQAAELGLTVTYRCPRAVVEVARGLVGDYEAAPEAPEGEVKAVDVATLLDVLVPGVAFLSRTNAPLVGVCLGLIRKGVAARIEGRDIGKALQAIVRKLRAKSVPDFLDRLRAYSDKHTARIKAYGKHVEARLDALADQTTTLAALAEGCASVADILARCESMFSDTMRPDGTIEKRPAVVCSSVHKAKGLEWPTVYILERTLYCGGRKTDAEEQNIHYVAVTRAQATLVMVKG